MSAATAATTPPFVEPVASRDLPLFGGRATVGVALRVALLAAIARVLRLDAFGLLVAALPAALVHARLPVRAREPFLLLLFAGTLIALFGTRDALIAAGAIGVSLFWLAGPVPFGVRIGGLVATWVTFAWARGFAAPDLVAPAVWGIVASLFLFRSIAYLYDLRHSPAPPSRSGVVAYFCLFPNLFSPLFPVVDFKTFQRTRLLVGGAECARTGVAWMERGVLHLILYRILSREFMLAPAGVRSPGELLRFLLCNYLVYLHVSGQYHLAIGTLRLFGYALPPTNRHWLLPSSFTDFWRRINIYWKDFMQKVFFYPAYFALKGRGRTRAMVLATALVFVATWGLHAWQFFWIRGTFLLRGTDLLFWGTLGLLVLVGVVRESTGTAPSRPRAGPVGRLVHGLRVARTLSAILLLWALWTSPTVGAWLELLRFWN